MENSAFSVEQLALIKELTEILNVKQLRYIYRALYIMK